MLRFSFTVRGPTLYANSDHLITVLGQTHV